MGYLSYGRCFNDYESAMDYTMSHVVPYFDSNSVNYPIKNNHDWFYGDQLIQMSFANCDLISSFYQGQKIGYSILSLFVIAFCFKFVYKLIIQWSKSESYSGD
ncbi:MAG: hypothetical protein IJQ55_00870 [Alphaproteobacteria bacterium]|nr:hypothetical protein [Alphaproteobacteria bacterium]